MVIHPSSLVMLVREERSGQRMLHNRGREGVRFVLRDEGVDEGEPFGSFHGGTDTYQVYPSAMQKRVPVVSTVSL